MLTRKDDHVRLVGHLRVPSELCDQQHPVLWLGHVGPWAGHNSWLLLIVRPRYPTKISADYEIIAMEYILCWRESQKAFLKYRTVQCSSIEHAVWDSVSVVAAPPFAHFFRWVERLLEETFKIPPIGVFPFGAILCPFLHNVIKNRHCVSWRSSSYIVPFFFISCVAHMSHVTTFKWPLQGHSCTCESSGKKGTYHWCICWFFYYFGLPVNVSMRLGW